MVSPNPNPVSSAPAVPRAAGWSHPALHLALLAGVAAAYLALSWRKWADPVVDFGRELYIPWQLAQGAVLYRDVEDFYGPLSQYLNAGLFRVFGPGIMTLVAANLAVFAAIVVVLYFLLRRAWGAGAALAASAGFIAVFGFSRYVYVGNFNYATPYAHEATHGMLVLVLLAAALARWLERPGRWTLAAAGLLCGLTLVLKAEIALAAAAVTGAAWVLQRWRSGHWSVDGAGGFVGAALAPTAVAVAWFARDLPWGEAGAAAGRAWLNVIGTTRYVTDPAQFSYSGLDQPLTNLGWHLLATAAGLTGLAVLAGLTKWFELRGTRRGAGPGAIAAAGLLVAAACLPSDGVWIHVGRALLGLMVVYLFFQVGRGPGRAWSAPAPDTVASRRILLAILAAALLARMVLAGRIFQFGFFQAALAGVVVLAVAFGELPGRVAVTAGGRRYFAVVLALCVVPGWLVLTAKSALTYREVVLPLGRGADEFKSFRVALPLKQVVELLQTARPGSTLLVLPEGLMLNYLARIPSPAPHFFYYSAVTENGAEARLVDRLKVKPPDFIVTIPRDLREYGIERYGVRSGAGGDLLAWMRRDYQLRARAGGEAYKGAPPDPGSVAYSPDYVQVFVRKDAGAK